jgi:hypothetical protein
MIAYKFLRRGSVSPFAQHPWPRDGAWVESSEGARTCDGAVHACAVADLPLWMDSELWRVELDDVVDTAHDKIAARRGRLLERVDTWTPELAAEYAAACAARTHARAQAADERAAAYAQDAARYAQLAADEPARAAACAATSAYIAVSAAMHRDGAHAGHERAWQAAWLAQRLGLAYEPSA